MDNGYTDITKNRDPWGKENQRRIRTKIFGTGKNIVFLRGLEYWKEEKIGEEIIFLLKKIGKGGRELLREG